MFNNFNIKGYRIKKNVHSYHQGNLWIAHDVNSGSLHLLDEGTFELLKACEALQELDKDITLEAVNQVLSQSGNKALVVEEISGIFDELEELWKEGTLFSGETEEVTLNYPAKPIIKAICLHVAHDCNLRCKYCFAGTGAFGGSRTLMDFETGKRGIDFVLESSGHRNHCEVDFFGGEPLLNFKVVKELVQYGRKVAADLDKTIKFTLTTNGVLLDDKVQDYLEQENIQCGPELRRSPRSS